MIIISIGIQCTNAKYQERHNLKTYTYPFDWMFSHPKFIFEMLELLLDKNMDIRELVEQHFFICQKTVNPGASENYFTANNMEGKCLYNSKYDVLFPHDVIATETIDKYIRRFERLKDVILKSEEELIFMYTSQSSLRTGNFTIDNRQIIHDVYSYIVKIYDLISKYRQSQDKFKFIVFDSIKKDNPALFDGRKITLCLLDKQKFWLYLLQQMDTYKDLFV